MPEVTASAAIPATALHRKVTCGVADATFSHPASWLAVPDSWSPEAEWFMGITRAMLEREGLPCTEVVATLSVALSGRMVLSDNPPWDGYWLGMLLSAGGVPTDGGWVIPTRLWITLHPWLAAG